MHNVLRQIFLTGSILASATLAPSAFAADSLEIRDFIGTIYWSNGDINVDVKDNAGGLKVDGAKNVVVDGGQSDIDGSDCKSSYGKFSIDWFGKEKNGTVGGYKNLDEMPVLNVHLPRDAKLIIRNSIVFTDGQPNVANADIELPHCGALSLGDVDGTLALESRGSADVNVGATGQMVVYLKGSGDLTGGQSGDVLITSQGSGDVELEDIESLEVKLQGSGDLSAANIQGDVEITSQGSGDIELGDVTGNMTYSSQGSGDLDVDNLKGARAELSSQGSGDIDIDDGYIDVLTITSRGSSTVEYSGEAKDGVFRASGSGDIGVGRVSGDVEINSTGSGEIDIDARG